MKSCRVLGLLLTLLLLSTAVVAQTKKRHTLHRSHQTVKDLTAHQLVLVDETGQPKLRLAVISGKPNIELLGKAGEPALSITLDETGHPAILLNNPDAGSSASLAVDPKGAHVKFDRPGGASSYLFLNNEGVSGVVLLDKSGQRRYEVLVNADGSVTTTTSQNNGSSKP